MNENPQNITLQPLRNGRIHEVCGAARHSFVAAISGGLGAKMDTGPIIWIDTVQHSAQVLPLGLMPFLNPARIIFTHAPRPIDMLWMAEESLRSQAAPIVVACLSQALDFTQGRRLQLAAEAGKSLGLFLVPEGAGCNVAETRWHCTPYFDAEDSTLSRWQLIKNKSGTLNSWITRWDEQAHRIIVVSKTGERPGVACAAN